MSAQRYAILEDRGLLMVGGADAREFLQGLISNDINKVTDTQSIYAALLTPQGKFLFDFFVFETAGGLILETEGGRLPELVKKLTMYKLRAAVELADVTEDWAVAVLWGDGLAQGLGLSPEAGAATAWKDGQVCVDPRLADAGLRALLPAGSAEAVLSESGAEAATPADYDRYRLGLGLPDGSRDLILEKSTLLESGFDELHGVDWNKGCYMGQELTARTKYRGLVKKRLVPVTLEGAMPEPGTPIVAGGKEVGELRSGRDGQGLALMRLEFLESGDAACTAGEASVTPKKPAWAEF